MGGFRVTAVFAARLAGAALLLPGLAGPAAPQDSFDDARAEMVRLVEFMERMTPTAPGEMEIPLIGPGVAEALGTVPRHEFVPAEQVAHAYENRPLPIGYGQTISQPYIVALMTELAGVEANDSVLEVGTGSGYQAAILAEIVDRVYSIEIIPELGRAAEQRLRRLGYDGVQVRVGDGYYGWPENAQFDAILVTAAASHIPAPLVEQLKPGGRMIIPVGQPFAVQQLTVVEKKADGTVTTRQILPVRFVPFTGTR